MPGRVRRLDRHYVRLSSHTLAHVEHLARLAGVSSSDVINYVLSEVFEGGLPAADRAGVPPTPPIAPAVSSRRRPAEVIPITRRHRVEAGRAEPVTIQDQADLRERASEARRLALGARERAAAARGRVDSAQERARQALSRSDPVS